MFLGSSPPLYPLRVFATLPFAKDVYGISLLLQNYSSPHPYIKPLFTPTDTIIHMKTIVSNEDQLYRISLILSAIHKSLNSTHFCLLNAFTTFVWLLLSGTSENSLVEIQKEILEGDSKWGGGCKVKKKPKGYLFKHGVSQRISLFISNNFADMVWMAIWWRVFILW